MAVQISDPYSGPGVFRKAQLHCHTIASDGRLPPRDLLRLYKDAGYAFVVVTDHNRVTRCEALDDATFLALPGMEDTITRPFPPLGPHLGRLFADRPARAGSAQQRIDQTIASGGIASLCHPSWSGNLWTGRWPEEAVTSLRGYRLIEIWNPHSDSRADVRLWDAALRARGARDPVWGVAVDDSHRRRDVDRGWIMVKVSAISAEALAAALHRGAFYASTGLSVEFRAEAGRVVARISPLVERQSPAPTIRFLDRLGRVRREVQAGEAGYEVQGDEDCIRVECAGPGGDAWSQPFWISSA